VHAQDSFLWHCQASDKKGECAQELVPGAVLRRLACGHASFHRACIDKWLARKACCPICQQPPV